MGERVRWLTGKPEVASSESPPTPCHREALVSRTWQAVSIEKGEERYIETLNPKRSPGSQQKQESKNRHAERCTLCMHSHLAMLDHS
jgi:hypothetical protein